MNEGRNKTIKYGDKEILIGFQTPEFGEASNEVPNEAPKEAEPLVMFPGTKVEP